MAMSILFQRKEEGRCTSDALGAFWVPRCLGEMASTNRGFFGKFTKNKICSGIVGPRVSV